MRLARVFGHGQALSLEIIIKKIEKMKLMEYMAPEMEVIELKLQKNVLLVVSGNDDDDDDPVSGGGGYDPSKPLD